MKLLLSVLLLICLTLGILLPHFTSAQDNLASASHILSIAWSPDGSRIAASFDNSAIKVWSVTENAELGSPILIFQPDIAENIEWTLDSNYLITQGMTGTEDGLLRAEATKWNAETGELVETLLQFGLDTAFQFNSYSYYVYPVIAFNSDFSRAAFSFNSRAVSLSSSSSVLWVEKEIVRQIRWSPDDTRLAVVAGGVDTYQIQTFDIPSGDPINIIWGSDYLVGDMQWNADSSQLAVSSLWANPFFALYQYPHLYDQL